MKTLRPAGFAAAATLALTAPASASVMLATYGGILRTQVDDAIAAPAFGVTGGSLQGQRYSLVFRYDTALGEITSDINFLTRIGGPARSTAPTPVLGATMTINGVSKSITGSNFGMIIFATGNDGFGQRICHHASEPIPPAPPGPDANPLNMASCLLVGGAMPESFDSPFEGVSSSQSAFLAVNLLTDDGVGFRISGSSDRLSIVNLDSAAVPEPDTWAIMILGLFGTGAILRRRTARVSSGAGCG
jgi:hypothetical protein